MKYTHHADTSTITDEIHRKDYTPIDWVNLDPVETAVIERLELILERVERLKKLIGDER